MNKAGTFTQVDNTLLEKLYTSNLSGAEMRVMLFIIRQTAGFHRESHELSAGFIAKGIGVQKRTVERVMVKLRQNGFISISHGEKYINVIGLTTNCVTSVSDETVVTGEMVADVIDKMVGTDETIGADEMVAADETVGTVTDEMVGTATDEMVGTPPTKWSVKERKYKTKCKEKERKTAPTLEEIIVYCYKKGYSISAERFYEYYDRSGWRINGKPIDDWRKLADRWQETEYPKKKTEYVEPYEERRCTFNVDELYMLAENWIPPGE